MPYAEPNPEAGEIRSIMSVCLHCNMPIVSVEGTPFAHAMNAQVECDPDPRGNPPQ